MGEANELSFSDFLASLDRTSDPEGFERLKGLGDEYESVTPKVRLSLLRMVESESASRVARFLEEYDPRADFFRVFWRSKRGDYPSDKGLVKAANDIGIVPANPPINNIARTNIVKFLPLILN